MNRNNDAVSEKTMYYLSLVDEGSDNFNKYIKPDDLLFDDEVLSNLMDLSSKGISHAQFLLGVYYHKPDSFNESFLFFQKAAEGGYPRAQNSLGMCYEYGEGTDVDYDKAFYWYNKAAIQGNDRAECSAASCYEKGIGTVRNLDKAFELYQKSAIQGYYRSQFSLGVCFLYGIGTERNDNEAFEWFSKAAEQGHDRSQFNLGKLYLEGRGTQQDDFKAFECFSKAAEQGEIKSQANLGVFYLLGRGTEKDESKAFKWFSKAAEQGDDRVLNTLGVLYSNGIGTERNDDKAFICFSKAAEQGDVLAQNNLGALYLNGRGTPKDDYKAFEWISKAADQGDSNAQYNLGILYMKGRGTQQNDYTAFEWFLKAAEQGYLPAYCLVGKSYFEGKVVQKDPDKAFEYYNKALTSIDEVDDKRKRSIVSFYSGSFFFRCEKYRDYLKAKKCFINSEDDFKGKAWNLLSIICFETGDEKGALSYVMKSANEGDPVGLFLMSSIYAKGKCGYQKDSDLSREFAKRAVKAGLEQEIDDINDYKRLISNDTDFSDLEFILAKYALKRGDNNNIILNAVLGTYALNLQRLIERERGELYITDSFSMPEVVWKKLSAWDPKKYSFPTYISPNIEHPDWQRLDGERFKNAQIVINHMKYEGKNPYLQKDTIMMIHKVFPELGKEAVDNLDSRIQELLNRDKKQDLYYTNEEGEEEVLDIKDDSSQPMDECVISNANGHQSHIEELKGFIIGFDNVVSGQTNKDVASLYVARILLYPRSLNIPDSEKEKETEKVEKIRDSVGKYFCETFDDLTLEDVKEILSETKHFNRDINWYYSERLSKQPLVHPVLDDSDIRNHEDFKDIYLYQHLGMSNGASFSRTCGTLDDQLSRFLEDYSKRK